ncbi:FAD-dependent monooxygenase [Nocardia aurantia]|uniref:Anhydrotetracycline monooxygenase n=1 Tax=Nocardia aurantia TaxID=2585199 RepID=A0A7K0DQY1_9NOCA|nr:FAD-dependent monooxygenase [Nocardia aurantia]MQY27947.1 Anhydrotetracycline monooxygenase [Nocardia aurantia]
MTETDVIVVGAGPTGLTTAAELTLAGVRTLVLDALPERNPLSRAAVIHSRTAELFDQRGWLDSLLAPGDFPSTRIGHFAGLPIDYLAWPTRHPAYNVPQGRIEEFLEARLTGSGTPVLRGHRVVELADDNGAISVTSTGPDGHVRHRARYLVAADGGHSTIRTLLNLDFPGRPGTSTAVTAEAILTGPASTRQGTDYGPGGHWVIQFPLEDRVRRVVTGGPGPARSRDDAVTADELRTTLRAVYGDAIETVEIRRAARIDDAARQITGYRAGSVFFAGDAAHIHPPLGGQGMNTGIGDAVNLGWKLSAAVHGWAPDTLLDTYHTERHPVGARVLANTRAQALLMDWAGTGHADLPAVRDLLTDLLAVPEAMRWMAGMTTGLDIRYDIPCAASDHLTGSRMPDLDLIVADRPRRAYSLLHAGRAILLDFTPDGRFLPAARPWSDRVDAIPVVPQTISIPPAILVRPDGYVCWTGDPATSDTALRQWFGAPRMRWCAAR